MPDLTKVAFFNARFNKTGIFQTRLALKMVNFYLVFGIKFFVRAINKFAILAFFNLGFGISSSGKAGSTGGLQMQ